MFLLGVYTLTAAGPSRTLISLFQQFQFAFSRIFQHTLVIFYNLYNLFYHVCVILEV